MILVVISAAKIAVSVFPAFALWALIFGGGINE